MSKQREVALELKVLTPQGDFLKGTVDVEIKGPNLDRRLEIHSADASCEIDVNGQPRLPKGDYQITVTPTGATIDPAEQSGENYGPTTMAAVRAFRQPFGLPIADGLDLSTGRLLNVAAAFACDDGRSALRAAVREVAAAVDSDKPKPPAGGRAASPDAVREAVVTTDGNQPQALYWLARYATIAGEYQAAQSIAQRIPDEYLGGWEKKKIYTITDR